MGEYDRAIQDFDYAIRLEPEYATAYIDRGWEYYEMGDVERAILDFSQAIRSDPENAYAYDCLAWLLATGPRRLRDGGEAVRLAQKALALDGRNAYRNTLAEAYVEAENTVAAMCTASRL
jgi:tetratricopeptide (TPR) repeat protein